MAFYNPVVDMSSIRINDDGDFVFDITVTETEDKSSQKHKGYLTMSYEANVDGIVSWYCHNLSATKESAQKVLNEIRELGREAWIEKYQKQIETEDNMYNFDISHSDTVWRLTIYDDEEKE